MDRGIWRHVTIRCSDVNAVRATVVPVLEGNLDKLPPMPSRTVRVFLSSTFSGDITFIYYSNRTLSTVPVSSFDIRFRPFLKKIATRYIPSQ